MSAKKLEEGLLVEQAGASAKLFTNEVGIWSLLVNIEAIKLEDSHSNIIFSGIIHTEDGRTATRTLAFILQTAASKLNQLATELLYHAK